MPPPTVFGQILVALRFSCPTNWWAAYLKILFYYLPLFHDLCTNCLSCIIPNDFLFCSDDYGMCIISSVKPQFLCVQSRTSRCSARLKTGVVQFTSSYLVENKQRIQSQLAQIQRGVLAPQPKWKIGTRGSLEMKPAAVLVPLCVVNGIPSMLFTLRSSKLMGYQGDVR